jgi:hypothetical protein
MRLLRKYTTKSITDFASEHLFVNHIKIWLSYVQYSTIHYKKCVNPQICEAVCQLGIVINHIYTYYKILLPNAKVIHIHYIPTGREICENGPCPNYKLLSVYSTGNNSISYRSYGA